MSFKADLSILNPSPNLSVQVMDKSPLAALYQNKYNLAQYVYPRDLASNPARQHVIRFTTLVPAARGPNAITEQDFTSVGDFLKNTYNATESTVKTVYESVKNGTPFFTALSQASINVDKQGAAQLGQFIQKFGSTAIDRRAAETIALYIPDNVNVQYGMNYADVSLTDTLGKPYFYAQAGASLFDNITDLKDLSISQLLSKAANDPYTRALISEKLSGKFGFGDLRGLSLNAVGQAFNPQLQVLFTSVGFRSFQFDFTLTPYSQAEADTIYKIVKTFKYRAAPEIVPNSIFAQGLFQKVPDQFMIEFINDGLPNNKIHKIGTCVLTNINVDYAPMGWATFGDGNPVQTKLTLQFQEIEIIDKTKIGDPTTTNGGY